MSLLVTLLRFVRSLGFGWILDCARRQNFAAHGDGRFCGEGRKSFVCRLTDDGEYRRVIARDTHRPIILPDYGSNSLKGRTYIAGIATPRFWIVARPVFTK